LFSVLDGACELHCPPPPDMLVQGVKVQTI